MGEIKDKSKSMTEVVGDLLRNELNKAMNDVANEMINDFGVKVNV